jgi:hypothetical protein
MESVDGLAFIGRPQAGTDLFVVTGDSGNGMTHGMVAALLLGDLIAGTKNPWEAVYDPRRRRVSAVGRIAKENLNVAFQLTDWVRPGQLAMPRPSRPARAPCSGTACGASPSTGGRAASSASSRRSARTSAASCAGTLRNGHGTVPATARASSPRAA